MGKEKIDTAVVKSFGQKLNANANALQSLMPEDPDAVKRLCRMAMNALQRNPYLTKCDPSSFVLSVLNVAEMGLDLGNQECALVPYAGIIQAQPMYQGIVKAIDRSGKVSHVWTDVVYAKDRFKETRGTTPSIMHEPGDGLQKDWTKAYACAKMLNGEVKFEVMEKAEIIAIRDRSQGYRSAVKRGSKDNAWITDEIEMARKTVLKRLSKTLPKDWRLARILDVDGRAEAGRPQTIERVDPSLVVIDIPIDDVIDTSGVPETKAPKSSTQQSDKPIAEMRKAELIRFANSQDPRIELDMKAKVEDIRAFIIAEMAKRKEGQAEQAEPAPPQEPAGDGEQVDESGQPIVDNGEPIPEDMFE